MELGAQQREIAQRIVEGESLLIQGAPGTGKSALLQQTFAELLREPRIKSPWAPAMALTPDRRRAEAFEAAVGAEALGSVSAPGGHRLVRSINSYAYLVISQWLVERADSQPRPRLVGGAEEDLWFGHWLETNAGEWARHVPEAAVGTDALRMELRNLLARAGEAGINPQELGELGAWAGEPIWELAARAYDGYAGAGDLAFSPISPHIDSARIQVIAARILERWETDAPVEGVRAPRPVPAAAFLDDLQDYTPATLRLVQALAQCGTQIVGATCPEEATAGYRGGEPELGSWIAASLDLDTPVLSRQWRSAPPIVKVTEAVAGWVRPRATGNDSPAQADCPAEPAPPAGGASRPAVVVSSGEGQSGTYLADAVRHQHFLGGTDWSQIAVIFRKAGDIAAVRRQLQRKGVPLAPANRATRLAEEPVCSALLSLLAHQAEVELPPEVAGADPGQSGLSDDARAELALQLATSPLVSADRLELFRLLRTLGNPEGGTAPDLAYWLDHPRELLARMQEVLPEPESETARRVQRAGQLWNLARTASVQTPSQGLWALWDASGRTQAWQDAALRGGREGDLADDRLDAVIALFRRADLWEQKAAGEAPGRAGTAQEFASELLEETVAVDSIAETGWRRPGVETLTASQAAGREWDSVYVLGLQDGQWPVEQRPGGLLHLPKLEAIIKGVLRDHPGRPRPFGEYLMDPGLASPADPRSLRHERRVSEARLLAAAVSRARSHLTFLTVENEEESASPFLDYLAREGVVEPFRGEDGQARYAEALGGVDLADFVGRLRYSTIDPHQNEEERQAAARTLAVLALAGVRSADPSFWSGVGEVTTDAEVTRLADLSLSPSRIGTARDCLLRWFLSAAHAETQEGIFAAPAFDRALLGTLVHEIAQEHPHADGDELRGVLEEKWAQLGLDEEVWWLQDQKARAQEMVAVMGAYFAAHPGKVDTEFPFSARIGEAKIGGRIDRVEHLEDGSVRIVDIKTGKANPTSVPEDPQLTAYQLALRAEYDVAGAGLLAVGTDSRNQRRIHRQEPLTDEEARELTAELTELTTQMLGPQYEPTPGNHCRHCAFAASCPAKAAGERTIE